MFAGGEQNKKRQPLSHDDDYDDDDDDDDADDDDDDDDDDADDDDPSTFYTCGRSLWQAACSPAAAVSDAAWGRVVEEGFLGFTYPEIGVTYPECYFQHASNIGFIKIHHQWVNHQQRVSIKMVNVSIPFSGRGLACMVSTTTNVAPPRFSTRWRIRLFP